jgi:TolB-like protein
MSFSTNSFSKAISIIFALFLWLPGCAPTQSAAIREADDSPAPQRKLRIAVLPFSNLSGSPVPLKDLRDSLITVLRKEGLDILDKEVLERFIAKHRIRYVGGVDRVTTRELKWETGADAVLVTSVELYSEDPPPKVALTSRLISTGSTSDILWIQGIGLAGNDSIGILELSLIEDPQKLLRNAIRQLASSLKEYLSGENHLTASKRDIIKFWPDVYYRSPIIEPGMQQTVAVVPFFNSSERNFAGEIMALHFVRHLHTLDNFTIIEPGIIRKALLRMRIIMEDGMSLADADALLSALNADLVLAGKVFDYQDYRGPAGEPRVDFSARLTEKKSREVVWACESHYEGDYGVFFFDWGKVNTAHRMASEMVASALETLVE